MSLTREHMLRELELLPAWQRNGQALPQPAVLQPVSPLTAARPELVQPDSPAPSRLDSQAAPHVQPADVPAEPRPSIAAEVLPVTPPEPDLLSKPDLVSEVSEPDLVSEAYQVPAASIAAQPAVTTPSLFEADTAAEAIPFVPPGATLQSSILPQESVQPAPSDDRAAAILRLDWLALQQDVPGCTACNLAATRKQTVFGVGDPDADWLIVGEAPGAEEDRRGEPFVGMAGQLLDNMLAAIQLQRGKNVYIANVLKCRPPDNRDPHGVEVAQCDPYLKRQVELIQPKLILALGKFAAQSLLESGDTIAAMRGKLHNFAGVPVIVTYHPAYLLRNLPDKAKAWEDLCFARSTMQSLQQAAPAALPLL